MFVDSHCHLDFPELRADLPAIAAAMDANQVTHALCISVELATLPAVLEVACFRTNWYATAGVHPDYEDTLEPSVDQLVEWAGQPKVVGIGETGLDYYRLTGDLEWQRERFRTHIRAARRVSKPLIIHTRAAAEDTLRIMVEEGADAVGGVMHCFTESEAVARKAMEMGFLISFSGIVTFKNARTLKSIAQQIPLERMLIETDSPYLAPTPFRGKTNQPAFVRHVAEEIASLRGVSVELIGEHTSNNFFQLFEVPQ
ncbi:MAG: TatD family hydrolase [Betaproteobacteria bacterium]|nr:TatD family hydrolase [Betaproteobacteria bacterium]